MSSREKYYEVDLALLREAVQDQKDELAHKQMEMEIQHEGDDDDESKDEGFVDDLPEMNDHDPLEELYAEMEGLDEEDEKEKELKEYSFLFEQDEDEEASEDMEEPPEGDLGGALGGEGVEIPDDLARELQAILDAELGGEAGGEDIADMGMADDMEEPPEDEMEALDEVFDIDPNILKQELSNIRSMLSEGNVDHHFGGKSGGKAGVKNAFGGSGAKKLGYQKSYGGGAYGKDVFENPPASLKKLNEAIKKLRQLSRINRAQNEKLNKYRGAVHTLREQLEDLNLFNAKLLYVNKLLQNKNLNEAQKKSVIKALDEAKSLGETKALFRSLTESFSSGKSTLNESTRFGSSSRTTTSASDRKPVGTSDRWAKLAGLK